jgi:hypothetical protein
MSHSRYPPRQDMKPLSHPDDLHAKAAQGWVELGNHPEANEELEKITSEMRAHPDVLEIRWQIYAKEKRWEACVDVGHTIFRATQSGQQDG